MSSLIDPFAAQRVQLRTSFRAAPGRVTYSHAAMLRQEIAALEENEEVLLPGLVCLKVAEAIGGAFSGALSAATALCLLGVMARVYDDIASEGINGLEREWGMPRTLNALDAFYALAQSTLLEACDDLDPARRLKACELFDLACHRESLNLVTDGAGALPALVREGAALGAVCGGADLGEIEALASLGTERYHELSSPPFSPSVVAAYSETIGYIADRSRT